MKRILFLLFITALECESAAPTIETVRDYYQKAVFEKQSCGELINLLRPVNEKNNPLYAGYKACAMMIMAKHCINPYVKWTYFSDGREMLEKAIKTDNINVELRFLRFSVQVNSPSFLGYNKNIKQDQASILESLDILEDAELKKIIIAYFKSRDQLI